MVSALVGVKRLQRQLPGEQSRHTFATWLEDAGVPVRVIDELMGHRAARTGDAEARGSAIGAVYRHLTPEMQARVLAVALKALAARCGPSGTKLAQPVMRGWPRSDADLLLCGGGAEGI
jgi:integrase